MYSDLPKTISVLYRKMCVSLNERFAAIGISTSKAMFLICLSRHGTLSQSELCKKLDMDKAAVAKAVAGLEKDGYITKRTNPDDVRAFLVGLTGKASRLIPKIEEIHNAWGAELTADMTDKEKDSFVSLLQTAAERVSHI